MSSKKYKVILSIIGIIIISIISSVITIIIYNSKTNDSTNYYDENIAKTGIYFLFFCFKKLENKL